MTPFSWKKDPKKIAGSCFVTLAQFQNNNTGTAMTVTAAAAFTWIILNIIELVWYILE